MDCDNFTLAGNLLELRETYQFSFEPAREIIVIEGTSQRYEKPARQVYLIVK